MNVEISTIINQMAVFATLMIIGFIAAKAKVYTQETLNHVSKVIVKLLLPMMVASIIASSVTREQIFRSLPLLLSCAGLILFMFSTGFLSTRLTRQSRLEKGIHIAENTFGNVGFIGIPLLLALFGPASGLFIAIYTIPDMVLLWTLGVYLVSPREGQSLRQNMKMVINPVSVAVAIALIIVFLGIPVKGLILDTIDGLGSTLQYISITYIGGTLAYYEIGKLLRKKSLYLLIAVKMIAAPLVVYTVLTLCGFLPADDVAALTIFAALPSMPTIAMVVRNSGQDDSYASSCILITTVACLATIPLVAYITRLLPL